MNERFLTLSDVRAMFNVSRSTVWRWVTEGRLRVIKVGNVTRIRESDLHRFIGCHEQQIIAGSSNVTAAVNDDELP
jgi:excisionase family DNA binding protein